METVRANKLTGQTADASAKPPPPMAPPPVGDRRSMHDYDTTYRIVREFHDLAGDPVDDPL